MSPSTHLVMDNPVSMERLAPLEPVNAPMMQSVLQLAPRLIALVCWAGVVALGYATWRRRRDDDATDLLAGGGFWLIARLGLFLVDPSGTGWASDGCLTAALDMIGLLMMAWPFLTPPLAPRWADRIAGLGLLVAAASCVAALWQWMRRSLGLAPTLQFTVAWTDSLLTLAILAALPLLEREFRRYPWSHPSAPSTPARRRYWILTAGGSLFAAIVGILLPLPTPVAWTSALTSSTAFLAILWLNWLELFQRTSTLSAQSQSPAQSPAPPPIKPALADIFLLLERCTVLFAASDLSQLLNATVATMTTILDAVEFHQVALFLSDAKPPPSPNNDTLMLRLVARWPGFDLSSGSAPIPLTLDSTRWNILAQGRPIRLTNGASDPAWEKLRHVLGQGLENVMLLPLLPPKRKELQGFLVLDYQHPISKQQRQLCRVLAEQVAIAADHIQLQIKISQQARNLARLIHRQDQETGQLRAILESIADGVIVCDRNNQTILVNTAALDMMETERSDVIGHPISKIWDRMHPAGQVGLVGALSATSPYGTASVFRVAERVVQMNMAPVETTTGEPSGVVAVLRDVTTLAQAETEREQLLADLRRQSRQLKAAADQLRQIDRLKSQFIVNMSHELRTPLNHIIGFSGVMLKEIDGPITDTQRQDLEAIHTSGKHLLGLVTDILDVSQIWAGKLKLTLSDVDLPALIKDAMSMATTHLNDKPIQLTSEVDPDLPTIKADRTRILQILVNLMVNAIKYTEKGQVTVSATIEETHVVISVSDTGIGIPPTHLESIFEEFSRVDNSSTRKVDGLGLGLSISRRLVELHGGKLGVKSEEGVGSTFYFSIPIDGSAATTADPGVTRQHLEAALEKWH